MKTIRPCWLAAVLAAGCGTDGRAVQVELIEDDVAQVTELPGGHAWVVRRATLPAGAREGDVVANGRVDRARTEQLRARVSRARRSFPPRNH